MHILCAFSVNLVILCQFVHFFCLEFSFLPLQAVSAFAPISNPSECPWGVKAFTGYLGASRDAWAAYDATHLAAAYSGPKLHVRVDQGSADNFLHDKQLLPENLKSACEKTDAIQLEFAEHKGYDHGYYFISTFVDEHIKHHAKYLA